MVVEVFGSAAAGAFLWQIGAWLIRRDRARVDEDRRDDKAEIQRLWDEVERVKREQSDLREKIAGLPTRADIQRLEERLEQKIDELTRVVLEALSRM